MLVSMRCTKKSMWRRAMKSLNLASFLCWALNKVHVYHDNLSNCARALARACACVLARALRCTWDSGFHSTRLTTCRIDEPFLKQATIKVDRREMCVTFSLIAPSFFVQVKCSEIYLTRMNLIN